MDTWLQDSVEEGKKSKKDTKQSVEEVVGLLTIWSETKHQTQQISGSNYHP